MVLAGPFDFQQLRNGRLLEQIASAIPPFTGRSSEPRPAYDPLTLHRSISFRSPSRPAASTLAHCAAVSRIDRCSSRSPGNFGGLPGGFLGVSMRSLSVIQISLQDALFCDAITPMQLTYRFRLRDTCDSELTRQARAVNFVWNS